MPSGCTIQAGAGVELGYKLLGSPPSSVAIVARASNAGYVAVSFTPPGSGRMVPADAVIGWADASGGSIRAYQVNGYSVSNVIPDGGVQLSNASVTAGGGYTTIAFTRALAAGRYPISPASMSYAVAVSSAPGLGLHTSAATGAVNLEGGGSVSTGASPGDGPAQPPTAGGAIGGGCVASTILRLGCVLQAGAGVELHYELLGSPQSAVRLALRAQTAGYVAIAFTAGSGRMAPADAVIGWASGAAASVRAYQINGYAVSQVTPDSSVALTNVSAASSAGYTTVVFTRPLSAGRYPIDPSSVRYNVAVSQSPGLGMHSAAASGVADFVTGGASTVAASDARDPFWVIHGALMAAAWLLLAPHAVAFARYKLAWSAVLGNDAAWFHVHRALHLLALGAFVSSMLVAYLKFGEIVEDRVFEAHVVLAWVVSALLAAQWVVAVLLRPDKKARRRPVWNWGHFGVGRLLLLAGVADMGLGVYLYQRKPAASLMPLGAWVAICVVPLITVAFHVVAMALRNRSSVKPAAGRVELVVAK